MTSVQKISLSLLIAIVLAGAFAFLAYSGLFNVLEARFYAQTAEREAAQALDDLKQFYASYRKNAVDTLQNFAAEGFAISSFKVNQSAEDIKARSTKVQALLGAGAIRSIRLADVERRINFSTRPSDIARQDQGRIQYQPKESVISDLPWEKLVLPENGSPQIFQNPIGQELIVSLPVKDGNGTFWGTCIGYIDLQPVFRHGLDLGRESGRLGKLIDTGRYVVNLPTVGQESLVESLRALWGKTDGRLRGPAGLDFVVRFSALDDELSAALLIAAERLVLPDSLKIILIVLTFLTLFLAAFFVLNIRRDEIVVLTQRVKRLQINLLEGYLEHRGTMNQDRWQLELQSRREEVHQYIKRGIGKRNAKRPEVDALIDRGWDEILSILGAPAAAPTPVAATIDFQKLEGMIQKVLAGYEAPARVVPGPKPRVSRPAPVPVEVEEVDDAEDLEEVESLEEAEAVDDLEEIEEVEEVESLDDAEPIDDAEVLEEAEAVEDLEEIEEVAAAEEVEALDEAEPTNDAEVLEEAEAAEDLEEIEEAAAAEEVEALDEAEPIDDAEVLEEAEAAADLEEIEEVAAAEEVEIPNEAKLIEDAEALEEAEAVEEAEPVAEAEAIEEVAAAEEVELLGDAQLVEETDALDEVELAADGPTATLSDVGALDDELLSDGLPLEALGEAEELFDADLAEEEPIMDAEVVDAELVEDLGGEIAEPETAPGRVVSAGPELPWAMPVYDTDIPNAEVPELLPEDDGPVYELEPIIGVTMAGSLYDRPIAETAFPVESLGQAEQFDELRVVLRGQVEIAPLAAIAPHDEGGWQFQESAEGVFQIPVVAFELAGTANRWETLGEIRSDEGDLAIKTAAESRSYYKTGASEASAMRLLPTGLDYENYSKQFRTDESGRIKALYVFSKAFKAEFALLGRFGPEAFEIERKIGLQDSCGEGFSYQDDSAELFNEFLANPAICIIQDPKSYLSLFKSVCTDIRSYQAIALLPIAYADDQYYMWLGYSSRLALQEFLQSYIDPLTHS